MLAQPAPHGLMALPSNRQQFLEFQHGAPPRDGLYFQRPYAKSVGSRQGGLSYAQHELLRQRKTPQGRQTETLDFANIDTNLELPATKHVLLSRSPETKMPDSENMKHRYRYSQSQIPPKHQFQVHSHNPTYNNDATSPTCDFSSGLEAVPPTPSVQQDFLSSRHQQHSWSQVPTVLPSNIHAPTGPTVSAGQNFYGPYWPDGTFSPYRPDPVRDDRFFHWRHSRDISRGTFSPLESSLLSHGGRSSQMNDGVYNLPSAMVRGVRTMQASPPRDAYAPYPSFQVRISSALDAAAVQQSLTNMAGQPIMSCDYHCANDNYTLMPTQASERILHRDTTLSWAYRVYIELLGQIQRDSKLFKQQNAWAGISSKNTKPTIFPRPPQRTQSHFGQSQAQEFEARKVQALPSVRNIGSEEMHSRPATAIHHSQRAFHRTLDSNHVYVVQEKDGEGTNKQFDVKRPTNSLKAEPTHTPTSSDAVRIVSSAEAALRAVESLCRNLEDSCTDGKLLAGCLAYGLGEYEKACIWYQQVLAEDSQHVEAMSNLAATLLALGRREDAIHYWTMAVKLRPSYFEAVEHLVGLFASTHRAKDAVNIINYIETCLKVVSPLAHGESNDAHIDDDSDDQSRTSSATFSPDEVPSYDFEIGRRYSRTSTRSDNSSGFGVSGYAVPAVDNGRLLALMHAKANMLYSMGKNNEAACAFENAILLVAGNYKLGIRGLIEQILRSCISTVDPFAAAKLADCKEPILLSPDRAQHIARRMYPPSGNLPGLKYVPTNLAHRAAISTTSNCLLSLAKIYQDGLSSQAPGRTSSTPGTREILALYYLSLSLQPSPSTANNVGILLAGVQNTTINVSPHHVGNQVFNYNGIVPGSGVALALAYYNYGLNLDGKHAHLFTNLGSLLKDLGELQAAIKMYETAVSCDGTFDIALANLANAVKDQGRIGEAIKYYKRAVQANPAFAEAVCGLATALNSVCDWHGRGGVYADNGTRDKIHVDDSGMMYEARNGCGWMNRVVEIVDRQLQAGEVWGLGILNNSSITQMCHELTFINSDMPRERQLLNYQRIERHLQAWAGQRWEGSRVVRLLERAAKHIGWQWYQDRYKHKKEYPNRRYTRPVLPANMPIPSAPTVLPFHTFTTPLSAKQVRHISQRNALRISISTLKSAWLPRTVYPPPAPPDPCLRVGYVSSDFNNHPLAHLMQSIFGMHDQQRVKAYCYATTPPDGSLHRQQIQNEAPVFHDASSWTTERLVNQIVQDGLHILVNLNGYTRGAKNEIFAARPTPINMSFMGFAGTLGAEWCDYVYADRISIPENTLAPFRYNVNIEDKLNPSSSTEDEEDWVYAENVIFSKSSFFCVDHKQSAPDANVPLTRILDDKLDDRAWFEERKRRWKLRKELFPTLADSAVILGNFNQLYKIDPTTFRMYLRILTAVPNAVLWLLRFPDVGEYNLLGFARQWAGADTAKRIIFTDVAPKGTHIIRASVVDLFLDTPECNAHTTAADVIWSGTPIVTWAKWDYKMCSRMASSIVASALPEGAPGDSGRKDLLVSSEKEYEDHAIRLASGLSYPSSAYADATSSGLGQGRLMDLRRLLWEGRWTSRLFDTQRWVRNLENAYWKAWNNWEAGIGGDIYM